MNKAIETHEKLLEGLEKRLRVVEVPIEADSQRFDKVESQVKALKYPIKDIYDKLDLVKKEKDKEKESADKKIGKLSKEIEKFE